MMKGLVLTKGLVLLLGTEEVMTLEIYVAEGILVGELRRPPARAFLMAKSLLFVFILNGAAGCPGCGCCPGAGVVVIVTGAVAPEKLLLGVVVG